MIAALLWLALESAAPSDCVPLPWYEDGQAKAQICEDTARQAGLTILDLSNEWAPRLLSDDDEHPQPYLPTFLALANERLDILSNAGSTRTDRYYELFGISPSLTVLGRRLADERRHACHDAVDRTPLRTATTTPSRAVITLMQEHLRCDELLGTGARDGVFDAATRAGLAVFQRKHMLPSRPALDRETQGALSTDTRELDFRALLRTLRERVVDASGLLEDGSASNAWQPVLGRQIDSAEYRATLRPTPLPNGAPDLVSPATDAAARALGWVSPTAATRALADGLPARVAVRLPPVPEYHSAAMSLRAEIDRGDVWADYPFDAAERPLPSPVRRRPTLVVYAQSAGGEVALVRWPTTIGSWKDELLDGQSITLRYKASPVGRRLWRDLIAAPAWFPPPSTPDHELVHRGSAGTWMTDDDAVGPGYRSAYGLMALVHHKAGARDSAALSDEQIRTHGSGNYRSILRGSSHGCHRLFNHLAIRLGSFLLVHHPHVRHGAIDESYARRIHWKGRTMILRTEGRGYRYEMVPPIVVDVLPGRRVHSPARRPEEGPVTTLPAAARARLALRGR